MNSIYTERENILPHHAEWLDGCGAVWLYNDQSYLKVTNFEISDYVVFNGFASNKFTTSSARHIAELYTHIPTGTEFCERVAEILGLPKPTFGDKFIESEQAIIDRAKDNPMQPFVDEMTADDKLFPGRNNTMGEGSLTQEDIEVLIGDSIVKPIKGMAIEVSRLSEEERTEIDLLRGQESDWMGWSFCVYDRKGDLYLTSRSEVDALALTITESPTEFLEYVAQQTGKEYKKEWGQTHGNPRTSQPVSKSYKFKTYRILDSLDGIPLDKRIPLSEWIPPTGTSVSFIIGEGEDTFVLWGSFERLQNNQIVVEDCQDGESHYLDLADGHWMRIV